MASGGVGASTVRPVDGVALARVRARLEAGDEAPWLHVETARRMAERLPLFRQSPKRVLDWWAHAGGSGASLRAVLPGARIARIGAAAAADWRSRLSRWVGRSAPDPGTAMTEPADYELVWANMLLHHVSDPGALVARWHRALSTGGFLMFSTLGPGTLQALRACYRQAGWGSPMAELVDMHDIGDMLVEAGFADPVMDQELIRLSWRRAEDALLELRSLGSNADPVRHRGLRTPRWRQRLLHALTDVAGRHASGRIELEFEVIYGHAFKPEPRYRMSPESHIAVDDLRRSLRRKPHEGSSGFARPEAGRSVV